MKKAGDIPENFSPIELYSFKKKAYSIVRYFMGKVQYDITTLKPLDINVCMFFLKSTKK